MQNAQKFFGTLSRTEKCPNVITDDPRFWCQKSGKLKIKKFAAGWSISMPNEEFSSFPSHCSMPTLLGCAIQGWTEHTNHCFFSKGHKLTSIHTQLTSWHWQWGSCSVSCAAPQGTPALPARQLRCKHSSFQQSSPGFIVEIKVYQFLFFF